MFNLEILDSNTARAAAWAETIDLSANLLSLTIALSRLAYFTGMLAFSLGKDFRQFHDTTLVPSIRQRWTNAKSTIQWLQAKIWPNPINRSLLLPSALSDESEILAEANASANALAEAQPESESDGIDIALTESFIDPADVEAQPIVESASSTSTAIEIDNDNALAVAETDGGQRSQESDTAEIPGSVLALPAIDWGEGAKPIANQPEVNPTKTKRPRTPKAKTPSRSVKSQIATT